MKLRGEELQFFLHAKSMNIGNQQADMIHSLRHTFIQKSLHPKRFQEQVFFSLKIFINAKTARSIYFTELKELEEWFDRLKKVTKERSILHYYSFNDQIDEGSQGVVFKGVNILTNERVAIKKISKEDKDESQINC